MTGSAVRQKLNAEIAGGEDVNHQITHDLLAAFGSMSACEMIESPISAT